MTEQERAHQRQLYDIYTGILYQNLAFAPGERAALRYDLACPEYAALLAKYPIEAIAGQGDDFQRAVRLLHHLAPRLTHCSWYDNHVPQNSLALLDYSYENPAQGINCLNKSKILAECCLSLGICARRVAIGPYSPYDCDTHVVAEIYDRAREKWIMLDPTVNGYFVDASRQPLSCLEMRDLAARQALCTLQCPGQEALDVPALFEENLETNAYFAKNLLYFTIEPYQGFGVRQEPKRCAVPLHFDLPGTVAESYRFRARYARAHNMGEDVLKTLETAQAAVTREAPLVAAVDSLWAPPQP